MFFFLFFIRIISILTVVLRVKEERLVTTETNPKTKTVKKWAYCIDDEEGEPSSTGAPAPKPEEKPTSKPKKATKKRI